MPSEPRQLNSMTEIVCPGSKSMTQRALVIAALGDRTCAIEGALACDDSRYLIELLRRLGVGVQWRDDQLSVTPQPLISDGEPIFCGNAGTAVRFGSCLSLLCRGELHIDGDERMRGRPLGPLLRVLERLGVSTQCLGLPGCPPVRLSRDAAGADTPIQLDASLSSQYASGLLLVAPQLSGGITIDLTGRAVSLPYLRMTTSMMSAAGAAVSWPSDRRVRVEPGGYRADRLPVEPDWSSASFLLAAGELLGLELEVPRLPSSETSLQGDAAFADFLHRFRQGADLAFDLTHVPDLIAPLAALALFARDRTVLFGADHTRVKECDRIAVLCREWKKLGATVHQRPDGMEIVPLTEIPADPPMLDPEDDHRMAMAIGLVGLRVPNLTLKNPGCVGKSFPDYWRVLKTLRRGDEE